MLTPGERAPDFTLPDQDGQPVTLSQLLAEGPLVLYFYPADFTPGCTKEACTIRDMHDEIASAGMRVVGIAPQDAASHARFREKHALPFTLLSDADKRAIRAYGVDGPLGVGVRRATFLIGADGEILDAVRADLRIGRHEAFIREAIAAGPAGGCD
ncbi:peroxiredoxin [Wenzhouxiangella sp. XN24]|uniref:peroxiredoxin n=1 Tax=Wenzhouxiangella sp. XN24 TaxID=2713569 RepID=UPI0013EC7CF2|nr:peroxiredoxin [Wenzhouxiangella sp. XN24]NGX16665.1 peroxiredoxin [Wenzhouxiangella sp. XN24]